MRPTAPGNYVAREITFGLAHTRLLSPPHKVKVVADIPNPRGHKLLVETGGTDPKWKSLDCYEWEVVEERP
jgi:hypothetical protein